MIPVRVNDVIVDNERETYLVLLKSDLNLDGTVPVNIGPYSALNISTKIRDHVRGKHDSQNLLSELLEDTDADLRNIRIYRDERGQFQGKLIQSPPADKDREEYQVELTDALALAAETGVPLEVPPSLLQNRQLNVEKSEANKEVLETISDLRYELQEALENDNFDQASTIKSKLNDEVRKLEQSMDLDESIEEELRRAYNN